LTCESQIYICPSSAYVIPPSCSVDPSLAVLSVALTGMT